MGFALPNGALVHFESQSAAEVKFTAITNAASAVVTLATGHNLKVGDVVKIKSGWSGIDSVIAKISASSETSVTLGNIDTSDARAYVAGAGVGSLAKISDWLELPQITEVAVEGGDQQFVQVQFLSDDRQRNLATYKAAKNQTFTFAHDSSQPIYDLLRKADKAGSTLAVYMYVPKAKETRYWSASVSFNDQPQTAVNTVETVSVALAIQSPAMTFYKDAE